MWELVPSTHGRCVREPTGYGLPDYDPDRFSALPNLKNVNWCEISCVPKRECEHCKGEK